MEQQVADQERIPGLIEAVTARLESLNFPCFEGVGGPSWGKSWPLRHRKEIARFFEHTLLKPEATRSQIRKLCDEALQFGFHGVCVNPIFVEEARRCLSGTQCTIVTVIGFPLGANFTSLKAEETKQVIEKGAQEIDMVLPVGLLKEGEYETVYHDIREVVLSATPFPVKVILETVLLTDDEKISACLLAKWAGAAFVKTSTGFARSGATAKDVSLMRTVVSDRLGVKAAGGIRELQTAEEMLEAGADRLGASASVEIMKKALSELTEI